MSADEPAVFTVAHPDVRSDRAEQLRAMARQTGRPPQKLAAEFSRLAIGPGKLAFQDYVNLRLFDDAFIGGADKSRFAGRARNSEIVNQINHNRDWVVLSGDKLAGSSYLRDYGFPAPPPPQQVYVRGLDPPSPRVCGSPEAFARRLREAVAYPVFGKPVDSERSLGSVVLREGPQGDGLITTAEGLRLSPEAFARQVDAAYPGGYLLQPLLAPAPQIAAVTGGGLATARVVTVLGAQGPRVLRACLKLPAPGNMADNYWRSGNVLARVELGTGAVRSATTGLGLELRELDLAADAGGALAGLVVPRWRETLDVVAQAQALLAGLPMIGWDVGITADGPVIVEINGHPDTLLNQLADRRGLLEPAVLELAERGRRDQKARAEHQRKAFVEFALHRDFG